VAFQRIDRSRNDKVSAVEIIEYLRENKIYGITFEEAFYVVKFYDSDEDDKLSYSE
jgi:Ca2+-binding EF-hand superfamily protein